LPHVPGHEFAGVVAAVGADVRSFAVGDRVTAPFVNGCGRCSYCLGGSAQVCPDQTQPGFTHAGSFAEQVVVRAADVNLVRLPGAVDFVSAAALGCRVATAFRAVTGHGVLAAGDWVAVVGCGGVGLSAVMVAAALGARVVAVDPSAPARDRAVALGASLAIDTDASGAGFDAVVAEMRLAKEAGRDTAEGVAEAVVAATGGGAHLSIDAFGSAFTAEASVRSLRRRGRHVQVGLMLGEAARAPLPWDLVVARELQISGSHGMAAADYPAMLEMVADGRLPLAELVGEVITLDEAGAALMAMDRHVPAHAGVTVAVP
jgi:alcohol dehydrogenase